MAEELGFRIRMNRSLPSMGLACAVSSTSALDFLLLLLLLHLFLLFLFFLLLLFSPLPLL
jgi:hypothetical protein